MAPKSMLDKILKYGFKEESVISVIPNQNYDMGNIKFESIPAYNINKKFHPKDNNWVGYIIEIDTIKYYIAGDTDITTDNKNVNCDVAFVPVGGTFTMDYKEAANLINQIKPQIAVPIHYGSLVGTNQDALDFANLLNSQIECKILMNK